MTDEQLEKYNRVYWRLYDLLYYLALSGGRPHPAAISDAFRALEGVKDQHDAGNDLAELDKMLHATFPELKAAASVLK